MTKGNCDGLIKYVSSVPRCFQAKHAADDYVLDIADAVEGSTVDDSNSKVYNIASTGDPIKRYSMIKIRDLYLPAVIRARVTNTTITDENEPKIPADLKDSIRKQMSGSSYRYEPDQLIGYHLGGPAVDHNLVPRSLNWKCDEWWNLELAVKDWCLKTGDSVDLTIVVFYPNANTPIPNAFGISLAFRNEDDSLFVDCREKIHFNHF